jgi:hypothetical protein
MATIDLLHVVTMLDRATNLFGHPLTEDCRARIFAAIEDPTEETWQDARSVLLNKDVTLWQATIAAGMDAYAIPSAYDIIRGLEHANSPFN